LTSYKRRVYYRRYNFQSKFSIKLPEVLQAIFVKS